MAQRGDREGVLARLPGVLADRLDAIERAEEDLHEVVRDLVLAGYSWADVGRMMGVSRQAARQRFGGAVAAWRDENGDEMPWDEWVPSEADIMAAVAGRG